MKQQPNRRRCARLLLLLALVFSPFTAGAEYIFLKSGAIIKGSIVAEDAASITLRNNDGVTQVYQRTDIMRTLYTNIYLGQQYVRLTNGKVLQCYMVNEDQNTFTFRYDINKPEEFTIPRDQVLFLARKNPNNLTGSADYNSVTIQWLPPMGTVANYNIYIKEKFKQYPKKPVAQTTSTRYDLSGLKSSTDYDIVVTALDDKGEESLPSNEVNVVTKNHPPASPEELKCVMVNDWQGKQLQATLRWKPAVDKDGWIQRYEIFVLKSGKYELADTLKMSEPAPDAKPADIECNITGLENKTEYAAIVKAFDNRNEASSSSNEIQFSTANKPPFGIMQALGKKKPYQGDGRIDLLLQWEEVEDPDGIIKEYRIYEKTPKGYNMVGISRLTEHVLRSLALDTTYTFEVRAVDNRGIESETNKEFQVSTTNDPPDPPKKVNAEPTVSPDQKSVSFTLTCPPVEDPDGRVDKYRFYVRNDEKLVLLGESREPRFIVKNLDPAKSYDFVIKAVDNRGMESTGKRTKREDKTIVRNSKNEALSGFIIEARPAFVLPIRNMAKMYSYGFGGSLLLAHDSLKVKGLTLGIDMGFLYLLGKQRIFDHAYLIPVQLVFGYKITILKFFGITPLIGGGGVYSSITYTKDAAIYNITKTTKNAFKPIVSAGVELNFLIGKNMVVDLGTSWRGIVEKTGIPDFISFSLGLGYRFN